MSLLHSARDGGQPPGGAYDRQIEAAAERFADRRAERQRQIAALRPDGAGVVAANSSARLAKRAAYLSRVHSVEALPDDVRAEPEHAGVVLEKVINTPD